MTNHKGTKFNKTQYFWCQNTRYKTQIKRPGTQEEQAILDQVKPASSQLHSTGHIIKLTVPAALIATSTNTNNGTLKKKKNILTLLWPFFLCEIQQ